MRHAFEEKGLCFDGPAAIYGVPSNVTTHGENAQSILAGDPANISMHTRLDCYEIFKANYYRMETLLHFVAMPWHHIAAVHRERCKSFHISANILT